MSVSGKLEVTIKINELPSVETLEDGQKSFEVDCDGRLVSVTVKPKAWIKLSQASQDYPQWVATITGKIGYIGKDGFILEEPSIQVFEHRSQESNA
jgi:hypothetical protein